MRPGKKISVKEYGAKVEFKGTSISEMLAQDLKSLYFHEVAEAQRRKLDEQMMQAFRKAKDGGNDWVLLGPVVCIRATDKAYYVKWRSDTGRSGFAWFPKSQVNREQSEIEKAGDIGVIVVREWVAREKGWL